MTHEFKKKRILARTRKYSPHHGISYKSPTSRKVKLGAAKLGLTPLTAYVESVDLPRRPSDSVSEADSPNYQQKTREKKTAAGLKQFSRFVPESYFAPLSALVLKLQAGQGWIQASSEVAVQLEIPSVPVQSHAENEVGEKAALPQTTKLASALEAKNEAFSKLLVDHQSTIAELLNAQSALQESERAYNSLSDEYRASVARSAKQQRELINIGAVRGPGEASLQLISVHRAERLQRVELHLQQIASLSGWRRVLLRLTLGHKLYDDVY